MIEKKTPVISVLVPAYNVEPYIRQCLDSILNQSFFDFEIIILDDGSTDATGSIIDEYASKYSNITVIHHENAGIVAARSKLMSAARGKYIGWVDADDFIEPDMYEKLYDLVKERDLDIAICNYDFYPEGNWKKGKWYKPFNGVVDWNFIDRNVQHWNKIMRRELIEKYDVIKWNDYCGEGAYAIPMLFTGKIATTDEELYHYRLGHTSMSNNLHKQSWYELNTQKAIRFREIIHHYDLDTTWGGITTLR